MNGAEVEPVGIAERTVNVALRADDLHALRLQTAAAGAAAALILYNLCLSQIYARYHQLYRERAISTSDDERTLRISCDGGGRSSSYLDAYTACIGKPVKKAFFLLKAALLLPPTPHGCINQPNVSRAATKSRKPQRIRARAHTRISLCELETSRERVIERTSRSRNSFPEALSKRDALRLPPALVDPTLARITATHPPPSAADEAAASHRLPADGGRTPEGPKETALRGRI